MDSPTKTSRPAHRRNASSKSNLLKSLVSSKSRPASPEAQPTAAMRTKSAPLLPPDHPHVTTKPRALGERHGNVQSPPSSPSKSRPSSKGTTTKVPTKSKDGAASPKKSKSSANLGAMFAKMNRSSKDLSALAQREKDKENTTPQSPAIPETPIWAQYAKERPKSVDMTNTELKNEIERYMPREYSPSKQRNFNGTLEQPGAPPTLNSRPRSRYGSDGLAAFGRRVSGQRASLEAGRQSEDSGRRPSREHRRVSGEMVKHIINKRYSEDSRKASGSSTEQAEKVLNVAKRGGGKVMAAVAALQGKSGGKSEQQPSQPDIKQDLKSVDEQFEKVLESRNIPEAQRQKMRCLTMRVKQDFIRQDMGSKTNGSSPTGSVNGTAGGSTPDDTVDAPTVEEDGKSTKRSRTRSRAFTFGRSDKRGDSSPAKKSRSQSKSRPTSLVLPKDTVIVPTVPKTPASAGMASPFGSFGRKQAPAVPSDYISYLKKNQDPTKVEVGRLHKLRILLRNETVAWVDSFISLGGMTEIVGLLRRTMAVEWREEHEDQLLHETLLCLKGLCTTERAMQELEKVADELFPALLGMLFDDEKKGPAEYTTRTIIINVLFSHLSSALNTAPSVLEQRALNILTYLGEPQKSESERPVDFVMEMRTPRPYKLWSREVTNVTKEVFWIFLHHLNVVPLPRPSTAKSQEESLDADREKVLQSTFTQRHFPGARPPVPAAPYIGGVEWDATTYLTAHLDLLNGLIASLPSCAARNDLRADLHASGFEKVMGGTLRTCKEKFYSGVHDGLRAWVAAAQEDGWDSRYVREGPTTEERAKACSPKKTSPKKKKVEEAPKLDLSLGLPKAGVQEPLKLDLGFGDDAERNGVAGENDGWLG